MEHVLDNPAWNALVSGNKHLSYGNAQVKYFDKSVSPFAAFDENTDDNIRQLCEVLPHNGPVLFVTPVEMDIPVEWNVLRVIHGLQMVCDTGKAQDKVTMELVPLADGHVPQMLALTKMTNPGPFDGRTIDFGHYQGIFDGDKLVAMAGQRLHAFNYAEISAVCTHPGYVGKGYARQLMINQINRIKAANETPFLHVRRDNERAIKVYESLGFYMRTEVWFYFMLMAG